MLVVMCKVDATNLVPVTVRIGALRPTPVVDICSPSASPQADFHAI